MRLPNSAFSIPPLWLPALAGRCAPQMNPTSTDKPSVTTTSQLLEQGHYARKQLFSRNAIVAWSHRRRFALARELASAGAGGALLDYGCGDGTFIALAHELFRET